MIGCIGFVCTFFGGTPPMGSPEAPKATAWRSICIVHGVRCLADRSWKFFIPLYLSKSCQQSLRPTAAVSLAQNLAVAALSTTAAGWYRRKPTSISFVRATLLENIVVVAEGILLSVYARGVNENNHEILCGEPFQSPLFILALFCGCVDAVCSSLLSTIISKEWVANIFQNDKAQHPQGSLANANARLSQIDLIIATLCPVLVSAVIYRGGYSAALALLVSQHAVGALVILYNVWHALELEPQIGIMQEKKTQVSTEKGSTRWFNHLHIFTDTSIPFKARLVTAAYILLYFTVLSPGSVLNAWLNSVLQKNKEIAITEETIAWFGSSSNLLGALATLITPPLIGMVGKFSAGVLAQFFQTACILFAAFHFNFGVDESLLVGRFLIPVAVSRVGLWAFDLAERQILQEAVPRNKRTVFFNTEKGFAQLVSLGMMYLCYIYPDPSSFSVLVNCSSFAILLSSTILGFSMFIPPKQ